MIQSIAYAILHEIVPNGIVFGALYRMFLYHYQHPYQYIAVISLTYGIMGATGIFCLRHLKWKQKTTIGFILVSTTILASIPGGILWKIHDMQAGFFPSGERFLPDLSWGASTGLQVGWAIALLSFPYNVISWISGYWVARYGFQLYDFQRRDRR
ncbi:MAG: hypothetical protein HC849_20010 [Oscillatoriales cyanobacterium RU_3_3]|nr:hypothetical protein [Microcoleus sp. SU_5_6]NJM61964.1 hypothetical protein [Oscillatoriales cyanobacterium RU_3_3]NJR23476.1 hypothetical protein [Richelia sp. CSU_2_1]